MSLADLCQAVTQSPCCRVANIETVADALKASLVEQEKKHDEAEAILMALTLMRCVFAQAGLACKVADQATNSILAKQDVVDRLVSVRHEWNE